MSGIKIPVSADLNGADVEKTISKLNEQMNRLGQTVASVNRVKFNPVGSGSLDDLKKIEAKFQELIRISGGLRDRIKATGQAGAAFGSLDWSRLYEDPATRARKMQQAFQHVTAGTSYRVAPPPAPPAPPVPGQPASGGHFGQAVAGAVGAGVRATGPVGGVVANSVNAGMSGGFSAGLWGLMGGIAALGIGKGIGAIRDKIGSAEQEAIGYADLKRTLGDVNVSFEALRSSLRSASNDISVTFEEVQKLGSDWAKITGRRMDGKSLGEEVMIGGGFGRSFGVDPSSSNAFFAQMRQFQVTNGANDSRKLAVMIGEAVSKADAPGKTEELLQQIAAFTAATARSSLSAPNVAGYAGMMSGFMGSKIPGLDAEGSAALLGRVNSAIMGGGGAGEAGQNFLFNVLGAKSGLDPVQVALLQQQGAFGTGRMAFGSGSLYSRFAKKFGANTPGAIAGSDQTNLAAILSATQSQYSGNPSLMLNATARLLGVNENQAMALHTIGPNSVNGMVGRMGRLGLDVGKLSATGIQGLADIEKGNLASLSSRIGKFGGADRDRLNAAMAEGNVEKLKDILTELTYSREQEKTDGDKTRESIQQVDKTMQKLATHMIGPMNDMRNALVFMAGKGENGAMGIGISVAEAEAKEKVTGLKARYDEDIKAQDAIMDANGLRAQERVKAASRGRLNSMTDPAKMREEQENLAKELAAMQQREAAARTRKGELSDKLQLDTKSIESERDQQIRRLKLNAAPTSSVLPPSTSASVDRTALMQELAETDRQLGMSPGTSAAQINKESSFNPNAYNSKSGAMGMAQVMPGTLAALERRLGRKLNPYDPKDAVIIHREVMRENKAKFGSDARALAAYNSGWDSSKWGNSETTDYLATIERNRGAFATPMPEGGGNGRSAGVPKVIVEGNFTLNTPNGARAAEPIVIKKQVGMPTASGADRRSGV